MISIASFSYLPLILSIYVPSILLFPSFSSRLSHSSSFSWQFEWMKIVFYTRTIFTNGMNADEWKENFQDDERNFIVHVKDWEINHRRRREFYPLCFFPSRRFMPLPKLEMEYDKKIFSFTSHISRPFLVKMNLIKSQPSQRYFNL